ncbi:hypothetical protein [Paraburkholderia sp.]|uniref:hypothetical protein n=1 Tax=Paraburkholderia sp. TaxID=1926495 RepID=UPI0039E2DF7C
MNAILNWIKGARWRQSLSHCVEGLLIQAPVTVLTRNLWFGALAVIVWYWSRKKLEVEIAGEGSDDTHVDEWTRGWFPWQWSAYQVLDVVMPAISSFAIAALF